MAHRMAPISVSIAIGHTSADAVKATARGCSTGKYACSTFTLYSYMPDKKAVAVGTILKIFGMTRPGFEPMTCR